MTNKRKWKMVFDPDNLMANMAEDVRTFTVLRDIANEIDRIIHMDIDICSWHEDSCLPLLDLRMFSI